jgi:PAS domain S-box-containing protein
MIQAVSPALPALPVLPESIFATAMNAVDACVAILTGPELRYTFVNRAFRAILPGVDMPGQRFRDVFPQAALGGTEDALRQVLETGRSWRIERYNAPVPGDAGAVWEGEAVRLDPAAGAAGTSGDPASIVIFVRNVTATVRVERALAASEEAVRKTNRKLYETIDNITDGVLVMDRDWRYTFVSERAAKIVGMQADDLLGAVVWELFPHAQGTKFYEGYHRAAASSVPVHFQEYYPLPLDMWLECHCYPTADGLTVYFRDVSRQRRADKALLESSALLRAISDTSTDVIFAKDRAGRFQFANPATLALIGKPLDQVTGRTDFDVLSDPAAAALVMHNDRLVMDSGKPIEFEETVPWPAGGHRTWLSRKIPYVDAAGEVVGVLGISRDITHRKRAEQDLRESNSRKDEFLAMLAHELRNPLAPIATGAQLLEQCAYDEKRVRLTSRVIARQALHMAALLDDLLDVSRVTRGHIILKKEALDMGAVLADAIEQASPLMLERGQQFHGPAGVKAMPVHGDRTRLVQAVSNLLNNAAKYTPPGGTIILAASADDNRVTVVVSDNGAGIDAELLPSIFGLFTQGERTPDRAQGGLGLGLALVKSIVTMHDGEVGVTSAGVGQGSSFVISLPRLQGAQ